MVSAWIHGGSIWAGKHEDTWLLVYLYTGWVAMLLNSIGFSAYQEDA